MAKKLTPKQLREIELERIRKTYPPKFVDYVDEEIYLANNIIPIEPMSAKEPLNEETLELMLSSEDYIGEEKKDGVRATLHLLKMANRVFSRNISKKTNWYTENSDSVPHIRDMEIPKSLYGTIIDGEFSTPSKEFKDISSIMNCLWDEAILRQEEGENWVQLNVFDIIYYKGVYVAKMPLYKRKLLVKKVVEEINSPYIKLEEYTFDNVCRTLGVHLCEKFLSDKGLQELYPNLYYDIRNNYDGHALIDLEINKKSWYEYIVMNGGEGLMLKDKNGTYRHTRGREYTKVKKFTTRDCILIGFNAPTVYYDGKEKDNPNGVWEYWCDAEDEHAIVHQEMTMQEAEEEGLLPVTKHYAMDWIGTILYGVIITGQELVQWQKKNPKEKPWVTMLDNRQILVVGECSGIDEETREYMTKNQCNLIGKVIELKCHEVLKTGKLRHPRFLRFRDDKEMDRCIYADHMEGSKNV